MRHNRINKVSGVSGNTGWCHSLEALVLQWTKDLGPERTMTRQHGLPSERQHH